MAKRVIPLLDQRWQAAPEASPAQAIVPNGLLTDQLARPLRDLRISVTDRCNFRCSYCMPSEVFDKAYRYLPQQALLTFEEITRIARHFVAHGTHKIRLTGGEPLLRKNLDVLIAMLSDLHTPEGTPLDLTLTTNASLLRKKAQALKSAGLKRLTISLDGLDDAVFRAMNDVDFPVSDVLDGISAARDAGFETIKINMVVKRGTNDQEILPMAQYFRGTGVVLRFIEYMDVGATNGWRMDEVLPSSEVMQRIATQMPLIQLEPTTTGETAERWGYADTSGRHDPSQGEIGFISSVTQAFCRDCNRARLSTDGKIYLCLFGTQGHDLKHLLRSGASDSDIASAIAHIWHGRSDRYSELRSQMPLDTHRAARRVEMSYIGG